MAEFLTLIVAGGVSGAIYSLIAAGLVVSYTATGIFNLGYGGISFASAYLYYELHTGLGWPIAAAAVVTIVVFAPLLGLALDVVIFRNLAQASDSTKVMATVGVLIAIPAFAKWLVQILISHAGVNIPTGDTVSLAPGIGPSPPKAFSVGDGVVLTSDQIIIFGVAGLCAAALWLLMHRTRLGLQMRAVVDSPQLAQIRGVNTGFTSGSAWIIGVVLSAIAGVVGSPIFNSLDPGTYNIIMFAAVAAAVIGGLRSVPLAFVGGLALGIAQNLVAEYTTFAAGIQGFNESVPFVVILVGLFVIGRGPGRLAGMSAAEPRGVESGPVRPTWRSALPMLVWLGLVLTFVEFIANPYYVSLTTEALALALVFLSYTIVTGIGGVVSLAQAAFVSGSGLIGGLMMDRFDLPWLLACLGGVAFACLLGIVVAMPSVRLGGLSVVLASLAVGFLCDQVLFSWSTLSNAANGWTVDPPYGLSDDKKMAVVLIVLIMLVAAGIRSLRESATGRAAFAVRSSESAAAAAGISTVAVKLWILAISAGIAGLGGFLLVSQQGSANNGTFTTSAGLVWLASVVLWGVRRSGAAIIAALTAVLLPGLLLTGLHLSGSPSWLTWRGTTNVWIPQILFGLGAIQMAKDPDGILAFFGRRRQRGPSMSPAIPVGEVPHVQVLAAREAFTEPRARPATVGLPDAERLLSLEGVWGGYGDVTVVRDVSLGLHRGSITALIGANGAGKSTLASMISGALPVWRGTLRYRDRDVTGVPAFRRARAGIIVAPEARGIFPGLSVDENLTLRLPNATDRAEVYEQFPALAARRKAVAGTLSGGEQQMLALGSILVDPPDLVVADEPTLGLAPLTVERVLQILEQLRDRGSCVLLIEEKLRSILRIADRVAFLEQGRLEWCGPREQLDSDQLAATLLGRTAD